MPRIRAMNALRLSDATARVVAWHNRHPLARRIAAAHVQGLGVVGLPFALHTPEGVEAVAPEALTPLFGAEWMYGTDAAALGEWVRRHGRYPLPEAADWPHRQVDADLVRAHAADAAGLEGRTLRHVLTAVIEIDGQRLRVLIAPQAPLAKAALFGRRLPSLQRAAALAGPVLAAALGVAGTALLWPRPGASLPGAPVVAVAASAASAAASSPVTVAEAASAAVPASAAEHHAEAPAAPAARPLDMGPILRLRADGAPPLVEIRPRLTDAEQREARVQAATLRPAAAESAASAVGHGPVYAIATPALRTRDDALAQQALLQGLKAQVPTPVPTQLAVMPAQGRWRVVWFPHPVQREAEDLVVQARARGLKVELIAF